MKRVISLFLAVLMLCAMLPFAVFAAGSSEMIRQLNFSCAGSTIRSVYDVPVSNYSESSGTAYGYVNLAEAFGEGAEDWYAADLGNSDLNTISVEKALKDATHVLYIVKRGSYASSALIATAHLYPKGVLPGTNAVQVMDSGTGEPYPCISGGSETSISWRIEDVKNDRVDLAGFLKDWVKGSISKTEIFYGDACTYSCEGSLVPASELSRGEERGKIRVYTTPVCEFGSVSSECMINGLYAGVNGKTWSSLDNLDPFAVHLLPVHARVDIRDYFRREYAAVLNSAIAGFEKDGLDYEVSVRYFSSFTEKGFSVDTDRFLEALQGAWKPDLEITVRSEMSEGEFDSRYTITSETASYTGKPQGVKYTTSHPSYRATVSYDTADGTAPTEVGSYRYSMLSADSGFLPSQREGVFTVTPADPAAGIPFETQKLKYDGKAKSLDLAYLGLSSAPVLYENSKTGAVTDAPTEIGSYNASVTVANNPNIKDGTLVLPGALMICESIVEHPIAVSGGKADLNHAIYTTLVSLTADAPAKGMRFDHWAAEEGNVTFEDAGAASTQFVMPNSPVSVRAVFEPILYSVTVEGGKADQDSVPAGTAVNITADACGEGRVFSGWKVASGNVSLKDPLSESTAFTVGYSDVKLIATFAEQSDRDIGYSISVMQGSSSVSMAKPGEVVTIKADAPRDRDQVFKEWVCRSNNTVFANSKSAETTFIMPYGNVEIYAKYGLLPPRPFFGSLFGDGSLGIIAISAGVLVIAGISVFVILKKKKKD